MNRLIQYHLLVRTISSHLASPTSSCWYIVILDQKSDVVLFLGTVSTWKTLLHGGICRMCTVTD